MTKKKKLSISFPQIASLSSILTLDCQWLGPKSGAGVSLGNCAWVGIEWQQSIDEDEFNCGCLGWLIGGFED